MTTANEEFSDLMPHRIKVTGNSPSPKYNDYGREVNSGSYRIYRCLLDDTTTKTRSADGVEVSTSLTAYVAPVPLDVNGVVVTDGIPVDISDSEKIEITDPYAKSVIIKNIQRHYDSENGVGSLHNIVVVFD